MGYSLIIGERLKVSETEFDEDYTYITAEDVKLDNAPAFGEPTDYTNERWPSYSAWHDFCKVSGLFDLFYEENGHLRGGHPGLFTIDNEFKDKVDWAHKRLKMQYKTIEESADIFDTEIGAAYARVQWLKFWTDWALENCKNPVFVNS